MRVEPATCRPHGSMKQTELMLWYTLIAATWQRFCVSGVPQSARAVGVQPDSQASAARLP